MANRQSTASVGGPFEGILRDLYRRLDAQQRRIESLEASRDQTLPADFRFTRVQIGGGYAVVIERVSTGTSEQITGPL